MECGTIQLSIDSNLDNVPLVGAVIEHICQRTELLDKVETYQVELCVVEATNNAIRHAYRNESGHQVSVTVALHPDRIEFQICDRGTPIREPSVVLNPTLEFDPEDRDGLPEGGMGLYLVHQVMEQVSYESRDGLNVLGFVKNLAKHRSSVG